MSEKTKSSGETGETPVGELRKEFIPSDDGLPCPITEFHPLHPAIMSKQATINIGTIGHVAHGKTTLVKAISGVHTIKHSHEKMRNITIKLGYANAKIFRCDNPFCPAPECYTSGGSSKDEGFPCERFNCGGVMRLIRHISFVDCPGHDILMATMLNGAAVMDAAVLLIAGNEPCPQPQTREHLAAIEIMAMPHIIVVQNKIDLIKKRDDSITHHDEIVKFLKNTQADGAPIIPASAQLGINVNAVSQRIVSHVPIPLRDFVAAPQLIVIRSFDVNKPGFSIDQIEGGVAGGSLLRGVLKLGMNIELRPGIITTSEDKKKSKKDTKAQTTTFLLSTIVSLKAEKNDLTFAVPGGLIGVGTLIDPSLTKNDLLVGQVLGIPSYMPDVFVALEIKYTLMYRLVGVKSDDDKGSTVTGLTEGETLLVNIGSHSLGCTVYAVKKDSCRLELLKAVCTAIGERIALSRKIQTRWRLIGHGKFGGGEKVFWHFLDLVAKQLEPQGKYEIVVFCAPSDKFNDFETLLKHAQNVFAYQFSFLEKNKNIRLMPIKYLRTTFNSRSWPFTLLSMAYTAYMGGRKCAIEYPVHVVFETSGYPCAYSIMKRLTGCEIFAYIHYPFAYSLERQMVKHGGMHQTGLSGKLKITLRKMYYLLIQKLYRNGLECCSKKWVNSSWTQARHGEISSTEIRTNKQKLDEEFEVLFPPCDSEEFLNELSSKWAKKGVSVTIPTLEHANDVLKWNIPQDADQRQPTIITVGQFRPEKDHPKQIEIIAKLYEMHPEIRKDPSKKVKLVMCGGVVRGGDDYLNSLEQLIKEKKVEDVVEIRKNVRGDDLRQYLMSSMTAVHTMFEEHFGIVIVEMMASGAIPICNPSGGMYDDVFIRGRTDKKSILPGFTAITAEEYAEAVYNVYSLYTEQANGKSDKYRQIQLACYKEALRFSIIVFRQQAEKDLLSILGPAKTS
ncbi:putative Eukaryotic translation initiation factor 2 subunit 3 [Blattamonas nauphoetae]|uniref:protein-synthesizing GTPase n=1 Tax=Blattamonas nauphoetae TaxID=2049346 RepID=A0ABQ9XA99_9EUKA|nr:putative Eukaryotic translation initiation factor 2 subunit 3 [Blattamonas nauphoetae]